MKREVSGEKKENRIKEMKMGGKVITENLVQSQRPALTANTSH